MDLTEWTSHYIDNMNVFKRDLEKKEVIDSSIMCIYKAKGEVTYIISPEISKETIANAKGQAIIVCLNTKANINHVAENWNALASNPKLKIIFANPEQNLQWSLVPYTHNMVSDTKNLKAGLKSIAGSVPEV